MEIKVLVLTFLLIDKHSVAIEIEKCLAPEKPRLALPISQVGKSRFQMANSNNAFVATLATVNFKTKI